MTTTLTDRPRFNKVHLLALGVEDLFVGRHVLRFNTDLGEIGEYVVEAAPHLDETTTRAAMLGLVDREMVVTLRFVCNGRQAPVAESFSCVAIGLMCDDPENYVIASRNRHMLPLLDRNRRNATIREFASYHLDASAFEYDLLEPWTPHIEVSDRYQDHWWDETETDDPTGITRNDEFIIDTGK